MEMPSVVLDCPGRPWQSDQDTDVRRRIEHFILQLLKYQDPPVTPEWQQKLPDFVKRLEEALYKNAASKDEYADLKTLDQRLHSMERRMVPKQPSRSDCNQDNDKLVANYIEGDAMLRCSNESSSNDLILEPKHKIFLSHSGAQKEFVDLLCTALEDWWHHPFFDRCPESLPKGEKFAELIIEAAEQCDMLIVVVSDEYFMSNWPMIELNAFVKAHQLDRRAKCPQGGSGFCLSFKGSP